MTGPATGGDAVLPAGGADVGAGRRSFRDRRHALVPYLLILPAFAMFAAFGLYPMLHGVWLSLFSWDGVSPGEWVGLENYKTFFTDPVIARAFLHVAILLVFFCLLPIGFALAIAGLVARGPVRGLFVFRGLLFLPYVLSTTVTAVIWRWLLSADGALNGLLGSIGLGSLAQPWLGSYTFALPAVGVVGAWATFGLPMALFIAGVQKIPRTLYEAARIDGAGPFREFLVVTLPGLREEIAVAATLTLIGALRSFDLIYLLTRGGPGDATTVPAYELYQRAFVGGQVGLASAVAVILTVVIVAVGLVSARISKAVRT